MSPIYVRPAREQSEHDRLIRHLQASYGRKHEVAANIDGIDPPTPVKIGQLTLYPDLVLTAGKKLAGVIEVETGESVNNLEVMAQWVHFAKARVPFHLYVPVHGYEAARRLCDAYHVKVGEIWTYRPTSEDFDLVRMHADPSGVLAPAPAPKPGAAPAKAAVSAKAAVPAVVPAAAKPAAPEVKVATPSAKPAMAARPKAAAPVAKPAPAKAPVSKAAAKPAAKSSKPAAKPVKKAAAKPAPKPAVKAAKGTKATKPQKARAPKGKPPKAKATKAKATKASARKSR